MQPHHLAALVFALMAIPAFVAAGWLRDGRLPVAGGARGMTEGRRRALDDRLSRLMRMLALAMLAMAGGMALWGMDQRRILVLAVVLVLVVNGLALAMLLAVVRARRGTGPGMDR
ncbi:hypothetical protein FZO89_03890 [Luteimonas viscosa]|uniref:Uncharacterized protein n=1 Tax=Luteimonas viscosa TaxID=1132694 RepID=A0A5D4XRA1_9GAMM|nr:hypothetical protein [Luteimonas viscosa]TYT25472.1 hypothetical protein FZO89_03890 [Luteimonas viscosa]